MLPIWLKTSLTLYIVVAIIGLLMSIGEDGSRGGHMSFSEHLCRVHGYLLGTLIATSIIGGFFYLLWMVL